MKFKSAVRHPRYYFGTKIYFLWKTSREIVGLYKFKCDFKMAFAPF